MQRGSGGSEGQAGSERERERERERETRENAQRIVDMMCFLR